MLPDTILGLKMYPKCFCGQGSTLKPAGGIFPDPLASRQGREGEEEGKWKVERWREDEGKEWKGEGMEGGEGKVGREGKGKGRQRVGVVVLGGVNIPDLTRQGSGSAAKEMT